MRLIKIVNYNGEKSFFVNAEQVLKRLLGGAVNV